MLQHHRFCRLFFLQWRTLLLLWNSGWCILYFVDVDLRILYKCEAISFLCLFVLNSDGSVFWRGRQGMIWHRVFVITLFFSSLGTIFWQVWWDNYSCPAKWCVLCFSCCYHNNSHYCSMFLVRGKQNIWYLIGTNFSGKKIWWIWRIWSKSAKLSSRRIYFFQSSAKLNSR